MPMVTVFLHSTPTSAPHLSLRMFLSSLIFLVELLLQMQGIPSPVSLFWFLCCSDGICVLAPVRQAPTR